MKPWNVYHWEREQGYFFVDKSDEDSEIEDLELVTEKYQPLCVTVDTLSAEEKLRKRYFAELVFHLKTQTMQGFDPSTRKAA